MIKSYCYVAWEVRYGCRHCSQQFTAATVNRWLRLAAVARIKKRSGKERVLKKHLHGRIRTHTHADAVQTIHPDHLPTTLRRNAGPYENGIHNSSDSIICIAIAIRGDV